MKTVSIICLVLFCSNILFLTNGYAQINNNDSLKNWTILINKEMVFSAEATLFLMDSVGEITDSLVTLYEAPFMIIPDSFYKKMVSSSNEIRVNLELNKYSSENKRNKKKYYYSFLISANMFNENRSFILLNIKIIF